MEEKNAVIQMTPSFENQLITYSTTEEMIQEMEKKFQDIPEDLAIKKNYTFVKQGISVITKMITTTETRRKELKKKALEYGRNVDKKGNNIKDRLDAVRQPMKEKKVAFDTAAEIARREEERKEAERQEVIEVRINCIHNLVSDHIQSSSNTLQGLIVNLEEDTCSWAEEHTEKVKELTATTIENLNGLLNMKIQSETAEKAEAEREAEEKERQKKQQRENARIAAENKKQTENLRVAKEKIKQDQEAIEIEKRKIAAKKEQAENAAMQAEQSRKDAIEEERKHVLRIKAEDEARERAAAQAKVDAEKQAKLQKEEDERKAKEAIRAERERIATEKLAAETLQADMMNTARTIIDTYRPNYESIDWGIKLVNDIKQGKFKHLRWI
ncbi:MAG: hypothetical protein JJV89_02290 [Desulfosarcina sp.]|nr:hypothetical protein [Desulfobacterales bacterium]